MKKIRKNIKIFITYLVILSLSFSVFSIFSVRTSQALALLDTEAGTATPGLNLYMNVWSDNTYIYTACYQNGIRAWLFDYINFELVFKSEQNDGNAYLDVWGDGTYIYAACDDGGLRAYSFDGTTFTLLDSIDDGGNYESLGGDGTYIYASCHGDGLRAYTFDGVNLALVGSIDDGNDYYGLFENGGYIYVCCWSSGIRAYTFDGVNFVLKDTQDDGGNYKDVWADGNNIFVTAYSAYVYAYTFDGSNFVLVDSEAKSNNPDGIYGVGSYLYVASWTSLDVYTFSGGSFTLVDAQVESVGSHRGVWANSSYVFDANYQIGLRVYRSYSPILYGPYGITVTTGGIGNGTAEYSLLNSYGGRLITVSVDGVVPGSYSSVTAALANSQDNDTIFVYNGTYYCNSGTIGKGNLTLIGEDKNTTILKRSSIAGGWASVLNVIGSNVNISGFTIENSIAYTNIGIYIVASGATIRNCIINNMTWAGVYGGDFLQNVTIAGNTFNNNNYSCVWILQIATVYYNHWISIIDNTFNGNNKTSYGIVINHTKNCVIANNHFNSFWDILGEFAGVYLGGNDINFKLYSNELSDCTYGFSFNGNSNVTTSTNYFHQNYFAIRSLSPSYYYHYSNVFIDNTFGIRDTTPSYCDYVGNTFDVNSYGMSLFNPSWCNIYYNNFTNGLNYGLFDYGYTANNCSVVQNNFIDNIYDNAGLFASTWTTVFSGNYFSDDPGLGSYPIYNNDAGYHMYITAYDNSTSPTPYNFVALNITGSIGTGSGSIEASDGPYLSGSWVILWANASYGSYFNNWGEDESGTSYVIVVSLDGDKTVSANFIDYFYYYAIFWANASSNSYFTGWTENLSGYISPTLLLVDGDKLVNANFSKLSLYNVTVRYENESNGMNYPVNLAQLNTGVHKFIVHYTDGRTDITTFENWGAGLVYSTSLTGYFGSVDSGNFSVYTNGSIELFEFRWNDTFAQVNYCTRYLIPTTENITFYVRTDLPIYGESTLAINYSLIRYTVGFLDETGDFILANHPKAYFYKYNSTGVKLKIHEEPFDVQGLVHPWLIYGDNYFIGVSCDTLSIDRLGFFYASSDTHQLDTRIPFPENITYSLFDLAIITSGWSPVGLYVHYIDTTGSTTSLVFTVYYFVNRTIISAATKTVIFDSNVNFSYLVADGCVLTTNYTFQINATLNGFVNLNYAGNYSTGRIPIFSPYHLSIPNGSIDTILTIIFGPSPLYDPGDPSIFVPWTYILLFVISLILLLSFGRLNAFMGGLAVGFFLVFAGILISGVSVIYPSYPFWNGPVLMIISGFIIVLSVVGLSGGVER